MFGKELLAAFLCIEGNPFPAKYQALRSYRV